MSDFQRRAFLRQAAVLGAVFTILPSGILRAASRIRIGVIGSGEWGRACLRLALDHADVQVRGLCEPDALQRAQALQLCTVPSPQLFPHWQQLVQSKDIDAVLIATPWQWHGAMALAALHAGKHVLCGPVAATTPQGHDALVQASLQSGKQYITLNETDFGREQLALQQMVKAGFFGDVQQIHTGVHCVQLPGHRYALQGASSALSMLGVNAGNPFVKLQFRREKMEYIMARQARSGQGYLVHKQGMLPVLEATTARGQSLVLQAGHLDKTPVAIGFRLKGSAGQWLESGRVLQRTGALPQHQWEAGRPYLEMYASPTHAPDAVSLAFDGAVATLQEGSRAVPAVHQAIALSRLQSLARKALRQKDAAVDLSAGLIG